ncbi:MAG: hypothetical protein HC867_05060 [Bacteroidia bacterium]|nr:hypothetical protein [Bacteroidia bacterium]
MGSSMGGLISLYTTLKYQDVFGMAAVFSPSLWFTEDIYQFVKMKGSLHPQRFMLLAGAKESNAMTTDMLKLYFTMKDAGFNPDNIHFDIHKDGTHSEWFWGREFLTGLKKISIIENDMPGEQKSESPFIISFNPDQQYLQLKVDQRVVHPVARVSDESGNQVTSRALFYCTNYIKLPSANEPYVVELFNEERLIYSFRVNEAAQLQMTG